MPRINHDVGIPHTSLEEFPRDDVYKIVKLWSCWQDRDYETMEKVAINILLMGNVSDAVAREIAKLLTDPRPTGPPPVDDFVQASAVAEELYQAELRGEKPKLEAAISGAFEKLKNEPGFASTSATDEEIATKSPGFRRTSESIVRKAWHRHKEIIKKARVTGHLDDP
ncbi:MAG: hypothetical protein AAGF45_01855 [Pseudomonadota bacterium]